MEQQQKSAEGTEPRTRGRSKTPILNLRVSVEKEINGSGSTTAAEKKAKKLPSVTTIQEEVTETQKSTIAGAGGDSKTSRKTTRTVTSDYSSDGISPDKIAASKQSSTATSVAATEKSSKVVTTTITTTTTSSSNSNKSSSSAVLTSNVSQQQSPAKKETRQNEVNRALEDSRTAILRTSTPKASSKLQQRKITLTPDELKQHAAYKEYKEAGEYWNKFPKTDYTYSELSPHRREIAPGVIAMPNMSRPGLNKHAERISVMIQQNPTQESYIRQRYASSSIYATGGTTGGSFAHGDPYDSGEEQADLSQYSSRSFKSRSYRQVQATESRSIVSRFFLAIVNFFYSAVHSVSRVFNRSEHNMYYTRIEDERGFFGKIYSFFNSLMTGIFKKIYLVISSVLLLDTWLLQTSASDVQHGRRKRKFILLLLLLLPFLLFGGIFLYLDPTPITSLREYLSNPLLNYNFQLELPDTEAAKAFALEKWDGVRQFTEYYYDNLKLFSENALGEIQKIWQENVNSFI